MTKSRAERAGARSAPVVILAPSLTIARKSHVERHCQTSGGIASAASDGPQMEETMPSRRKQQPNLREQAYDRIRTRILEGEFEPDTLLSENLLAEDLGFSRTPIREAIRDLSKAGLVDILPKRGIVVRGISATDILEIFQIRDVLEALAISIAVGRLTDDQVAAMREDHERSLSAASKGRKREAYDYAVRMHRHILAVCNNRRLDHFVHFLDDQVHRLGLMTLAVPGRLDQALSEHGAIVQAIEARSTEKARRLMSAHLAADRDAALTRAIPASAPGAGAF